MDQQLKPAGAASHVRDARSSAAAELGLRGTKLSRPRLPPGFVARPNVDALIDAGTLGPFSVAEKLLIGLFHGAMPSTAGFNTLDIAQLQSATLLVTDIQMFIGGGSAGTTGGIKVTTFALLAFVLLAEVRAEPTVHAMGRRLGNEVQRQAVTVALLGASTILV